jgi:hypothetical protein
MRLGLEFRFQAVFFRHANRLKAELQTYRLKAELQTCRLKAELQTYSKRTPNEFRTASSRLAL